MMKSISGGNFAGLAIIIGAPLYVVAEIVKRQGSMATSGTSALLENPALSHVMAQLSMLGLIATLFGLYAFWRAAHEDTLSSAFIRFGLLTLAVGITGFIITNGLDHITLHLLTHDDTARAEVMTERAYVVSSVRTGVVVACGVANIFGTLLLAVGLGMSFESAFQRAAARLMAFLSGIGLAANLMSTHLHTAPLAMMVGFSTLLVMVWFIILGVGLASGKGKLTHSSQTG